MASSLNSGGYGGLVGGTRNNSFHRAFILQSSGVHLTVSSPACLGGWVFVGYIDEYGEEREASYPCRRCAASSR